jgi:hypothetical protein
MHGSGTAQHCRSNNEAYVVGEKCTAGVIPAARNIFLAVPLMFATRLTFDVNDTVILLPIYPHLSQSFDLSPVTHN